MKKSSIPTILDGNGLISLTTKYNNDTPIYRYQFTNPAYLEDFFIKNFNELARQGFSSKAIGNVLLVFEYKRG